MPVAEPGVVEAAEPVAEIAAPVEIEPISQGQPVPYEIPVADPEPITFQPEPLVSSFSNGSSEVDSGVVEIRAAQEIRPRVRCPSFPQLFPPIPQFFNQQ